MNDLEKKETDKIRKNFSILNDKKKFSLIDGEKLISKLAVVLGIYATNKTKELENLIESMINLGKKHRLSMQGSIIEYNKLKKGILKVKKIIKIGRKHPT